MEKKSRMHRLDDRRLGFGRHDPRRGLPSGPKQKKNKTYLLFDDGDAATAVKTHVLPAIKRKKYQFDILRHPKDPFATLCHT